jgi:V/A-type H+-transporting ATPase subunit C
MYPFRGRNGNYAYACARVKARKSLLLTKDNYPKFLLMDLNEIGRFLGESQYKTEMSELAARYEGVNLIELGTSRNLARSYTEMLEFTKGDLQEMLASYLTRWDIWNIKTILRGKFYGASVEEIREDLVPAGGMKENELNQLLSFASANEILEALKKTNGMVVPEEVIALYEKNSTLAPIEDYLDKYYYETLLQKIDATRKPERIFLSYIRREIDTTNLMTLLKLKKEGTAAEKVISYFIAGGEQITKDSFDSLAAMDNVDQIAGELSKFTFFEDIKDPLEAAKSSGNLGDLAMAMKRYSLRLASKMSHVYPLSILPIVDYMISKKNEVDNIRIIARGKESGLDSDLIKSLLVV